MSIPREEEEKVAVTAVCLSVGAVMVVLTSGSQPAEPGLSKARR